LLGHGQLIFGPCLLLGGDDRTGASMGLPESFHAWLDRKAEAVTEELIANVLGGVGIPDTATPMIRVIRIY
jgi:hypothetical protein